MEGPYQGDGGACTGINMMVPRTPTNTSPNMGEEELHRSFMARFFDVSVKIHNPNPEIAFHSMFMTLKVKSFPDNMCRDPPTNIEDLRTRATNYIQMEEMTEFYNSVCARKVLNPVQPQRTQTS
ncbi:hypothetical protein CR513_17511, partial [Mucuna pruriens]